MIRKALEVSLKQQKMLELLINSHLIKSKVDHFSKDHFPSTIYFHPIYSFSSSTTHNKKKQKIFTQQQQETNPNQQQQTGTQYTNWLLTRSLNHNHDISHLKRKHLKDRFSIHKLTNIKFLCALANHKTQYTLNTNEKIILLAQLNHVFNILGKQKKYYNQFSTLSCQIREQLKDPHDLICLGTFLSVLANIGDLKYDTWLAVIDSLLVKKSDQQYDEIFGIVSALAKYKQEILEMTDFHQVKSNTILQFIPVIYRNHLQLIRQFIKFNIYNLKQCRILFRCLHLSNINQKYFWRSINDWFNIYMKQQVTKKNLDQFFIVNQKTIEKVINDDGIIRPRPILQQLTEIVYIVTENLADGRGVVHQKDRFGVRRFMQFVEDLVIYAIQNGSALYANYLDNYQHKEQTRQQSATQQNPNDNQSSSSFSQQQSQYQQQSSPLNQHFQTTTAQQQQRIKLMQQSYKTIFINPIDIKNQTIVQLLVMMRKCCGYDKEGNVPENIKGEAKQEEKVQFIRPQQLIDINVLKWLVVRLCKDQMRYTIGQLLQIIASQDFLSFAKINLDQLIVDKLKYLRSPQASLNDLKTLMLFLPPSKFPVLKPILLNFLNKSHPSQIYQLTKIIEMQSVSIQDNQYPPQYPRKQQPQRWLCQLGYYFLALPQQVNKHYKYYSFEENCYFLYYLLKNQVYWQAFFSENSYNYLGEMEILKESVKIASYSRGFKLQMNSYFYKLLNYVDLVQFFQGGNVA